MARTHRTAARTNPARLSDLRERAQAVVDTGNILLTRSLLA
jgi:hypothetical protein